MLLMLKGVGYSAVSYWQSVSSSLYVEEISLKIGRPAAYIGHAVAIRVCDTVPTNTVPVLMTTVTVMDSGSVYTGLLEYSS